MLIPYEVFLYYVQLHQEDNIKVVGIRICWNGNQLSSINYSYTTGIIIYDVR